jgi:uncharacterized protein
VPLRSATVVLTGQCNLRCEYCYTRGRRRRTAAWPVLRRSLDAVLARSDGPVEIGFTGGEPLLALPLLKRVVAHVERGRERGAGLQWTLLTNGLLLSDATLDYLEAHQFRVDLSFDGIAPALAARGRALFPALDALLDRIREQAPAMWDSRLKIMVTLWPGAVPYVADSMRYFVSKGVKAMALEPAMGRFDWPLARRDELNRQFQSVHDVSLDHFHRTREVPLALFRKKRPDDVAPPPEWLCLAPQGENLTVDVDGQVYGCVLASSTYQGEARSATRQAADALHVGAGDSADFPDRVSAMAAMAQRAGVFQHAGQRYSSYGRCADCRFVGRCMVCPLAPACDPSCDDPRRVSDFICAFNQVSLAWRDAFPCRPGVLELLDRLRGAAPATANAAR